MTASSIEYFIREACRSLWRNAFMTFASIITVTLSLLILGIFILVGVNLNHMASQVESTVEISIYLKDDIEEPVRLDMEQKLRGLYGVSEIEFVTKDEALERFRERLGDRECGGEPLAELDRCSLGIGRIRALGELPDGDQQAVGTEGADEARGDAD